MVGEVSPLKVRQLSLNSTNEMWNLKFCCISVSIFVCICHFLCWRREPCLKNRVWFFICIPCFPKSCTSSKLLQFHCFDKKSYGLIPTLRIMQAVVTQLQLLPSHSCDCLWIHFCNYIISAKDFLSFYSEFSLIETMNVKKYSIAREVCNTYSLHSSSSVFPFVK